MVKTDKSTDTGAGTTGQSSSATSPKHTPHFSAAEARIQIHQLESTIQALRDELDEARLSTSQAVQKTKAHHEAEMHQLQSTVSQLRDKLEEAHFERQRAVQAIRAEHEAELDQLRKTIAVLRDELDQAIEKKSEVIKGN